MTDLTVSFLFVILILLAFFATQFKPEETVPRDEYEALKNELSEACKKFGASKRLSLRHAGVSTDRRKNSENSRAALKPPRSNATPHGSARDHSRP